MVAETGLTFSDVSVDNSVLVVGTNDVLLMLGEAKAVRTDCDDNVEVVVFIASDGLGENTNVDPLVDKLVTEAVVVAGTAVICTLLGAFIFEIPNVKPGVPEDAVIDSVLAVVTAAVLGFVMIGWLDVPTTAGKVVGGI